MAIFTVSFLPQLAAGKLAAQDDGLVVSLENIVVGCVKNTKNKKVTGSQDDNSSVILTFPTINLRVVHSRLNLPLAKADCS
jgi:hypothetical protein